MGVAVGKDVAVRVGINVGNSIVAVGVAGSGVAEGGTTVSIETQAPREKNAMDMAQRKNDVDTRLLLSLFISW